MAYQSDESIVVVEALPSQIESVADAMARAFDGEAMMSYVMGNAQDAHERLARLFASGLRYAMAVGAVYVPKDVSAGGAMGWPLPPHEVSPEIAALMEPPEAALGADAAARFGEVVAHVEGHLQQLVPPPVWYLPALGVAPEYQGRGIGTALMRNVMARAEMDNIPASWSTWSESNARFYRGLGAEVVGEGELPGPRLHYWLFRWTSR